MSYIGNQPTSVAFLTDQFSANGSGTVFTLSAAPANTASIIVAVSGVLQDPSTYSVTGTSLTFSAAPPAGTGNISVRFLGIPASGVTTTAYRTLTEFTATAGQTTFTPPSYTVGYISVYRNGVMLGSADYTASNGTTVVLATGATAGDLITTESFYVSSVLNAIPAVAGAVTSAYIQAGAALANIGAGGVTQSYLGANVAGNGPAFNVWKSSSQNISGSTWTKVTFDQEEFDTNSNFASSTFTPTVAGYYQVNAVANLSNTTNTASGNSVAIYKNGSIYKKAEWNAAGGNLYINDTTQCISTVTYMNGTTDYLEVYCYESAAGTPQIVGSSDKRTSFSASMVRAA